MLCDGATQTTLISKAFGPELLDPPAAGNLRAILDHRLQDAQCRPRGTLSIVLVRDGCAEERQHSVARQVIHIAAEALDLGGDTTNRLPEQASKSSATA